MSKLKDSQFCCMTCKYFTIVKSNLQKHLLTKKHLDLQDTPEVVGKTIISYQCKVCDKCYKSHSGLWKHSLMCKEKECDEKISFTSELTIYDKKITVLEKEKENTELLIKLQDLKNVETLNKQAIFHSRGLCGSSSSVTSETTDSATTVLSPPKEHFIYMIREREFSHDNVYKIGRSSMSNCTRMKSYPKGSQIICINSCIDSIKFEYVLIQLFKYKFTQETEYGSEYFRGDIKEMKNEILKLLLDESKGYANGENIASLQFEIDNNKELTVEKLSCKMILELKELLQEKIIEMANKVW